MHQHSTGSKLDTFDRHVVLKGGIRTHVVTTGDGKTDQSLSDYLEQALAWERARNDAAEALDDEAAASASQHARTYWDKLKAGLSLRSRMVS